MAISSCLVDTNILLRMTRRSDPQHQTRRHGAFSACLCKAQSFTYTHQNIAELWNAMTRPLVAQWSRFDRGRGRTRSARNRSRHESLYQIVKPFIESGGRIVVQQAVMGVQVHDARLAAAMYVHSVSHILTLNVPDFSRFSGLSAVHPSAL